MSLESGEIFKVQLDEKPHDWHFLETFFKK